MAGGFFTTEPPGKPAKKYYQASNSGLFRNFLSFKRLFSVISLHATQGNSVGIGKNARSQRREDRNTTLTHQVRVVVSRGRVDVGHEGTVLDVLIVAHDVNGIFTRLLGPVLDITRPVILVIILNLRLRGAFDGKPWGRGRKTLWLQGI